MSETRRRYLFSALVKRNLLIHRTALQTIRRIDAAAAIEVLEKYKPSDGDAFWLHRIFVSETSHIVKSTQRVIDERQLSGSTMAAKSASERACENPRVK